MVDCGDIDDEKIHNNDDNIDDDEDDDDNDHDVIFYLFSGLRLLGIGRNQYIELMNQCRSSKVLILTYYLDCKLKRHVSNITCF